VGFVKTRWIFNIFFGLIYFLYHLLQAFAMRNRAFIYAVLSLSLSWVTACAQLPDYAKPRTIQTDEIHKVITTGFTYRPLTPEDFRATSLPENLSMHEGNINAQSAILIRLRKDSKFSITPWAILGQVNYLGRINHLAFEAVMIPENSWLNPKNKAAITDYVLQHEQIHFALTELAARKLTKDTQKWWSDLMVLKQTPQQVHDEIVQQIKGKINSAMADNKKRHLEFDQDTSLFYNPSWQAWWLERVEEELKQTKSGWGISPNPTLQENSKYSFVY
jgi:hypothetical protein